MLIDLDSNTHTNAKTNEEKTAIKC